MLKQKRIVKELLLLSVPTVIEEIMSTLLQYVDTAMVGRLGEQATAAVSTTTTVTWLVSCLPYAVAAAIMALVSRECGANHPDQTRRFTGVGFLLAIAVGAFLTVLCLILSPVIPKWMGADEKVQAAASSYFAIYSLALIFRSFDTILGAAIRATKDTGTPMKINLFANGCNVVLNYLLIYVFGLGVNGAAIATAISYTLCGLLMISAARANELTRFSKRDLIADKEVFAAILPVSIPAYGTSAAACLGYVLFAGMVSSMGTTVFAAHSIAVTAETLFYIPGYGLRTATSSLVGNALGSGDTKKMLLTERSSIVITVVAMFFSGAVLYVLSVPLMTVFTPSRQVIELGSDMLRLIAFTEPFFGLTIVLEGIFYGLGKAKGVFVIETGSMYLIRLLSSFFVVKVWELSLKEVWYCMIADNVTKSVLLFALYLCMLKKRRKGVL